MLSIQDQPEGQGEELNADSALLAMATRGWQSMRLANPKILSSVAWRILSQSRNSHRGVKAAWKLI